SVTVQHDDIQWVKDCISFGVYQLLSRNNNLEWVQEYESLKLLLRPTIEQDQKKVKHSVLMDFLHRHPDIMETVDLVFKYKTSSGNLEQKDLMRLDFNFQNFMKLVRPRPTEQANQLKVFSDELT